MLITWVVSLVAVQSYNPDQAFYDFLALEMQAMFVIELIFLAIGLLLGCAMKQYKRSGSTAVAIILATYFMSIISAMNENLDFLKYFTPFKYFDAGELFRSGKMDGDLPADLGGDHRRQRGCGILGLQQARSLYLEVVGIINPTEGTGSRSVFIFGSHLALGAEITRSSQVLHFFHPLSAFGTGLAGCMAVHQADIAARFVEQIGFIVASALLYRLEDRVLDGVEQVPALTGRQVCQGVAGMEARIEQDVLRNGVSQPGDQLVLGQKALDAAFLAL